MQLAIVISSLAFIHPALSSVLPEDSFDTSFFSENNPTYHEFDAASSLPFDDWDQSLGSSDFQALSLEDNFFPDSSANVPLEDQKFADSADLVLDSSCMTDDSGYPGYFKRDGSFCAPPANEPLPLLELPDLDKIESNVNYPKITGSNIPSSEIPPITGISRNDDLCPLPRRRLCCTGPIGQLVPGFIDIYIGVNDCRGTIKAYGKVLLILPRLLSR